MRSTTYEALVTRADLDPDGEDLWQSKERRVGEDVSEDLLLGPQRVLHDARKRTRLLQPHLCQTCLVLAAFAEQSHYSAPVERKLDPLLGVTSCEPFVELVAAPVDHLDRFARREKRGVRVERMVRAVRVRLGPVDPGRVEELVERRLGSCPPDREGPAREDRVEYRGRDTEQAVPSC